MFDVRSKMAECSAFAMLALMGLVACGGDASAPSDPTKPPISGPVVAFVASQTGTKGLWVTDINGQSKRLLTQDTSAMQEPAWSPDGASLAFMLTLPDRIEIDVMNADGSGRTRIVNGRTNSADPAWSPDGQRLAFAGGPHGRDTIFVMNRDGSNVSVLTSSEWDDGQPAWSPNGQLIAFTSLRDQPVATSIWRRLFLMNADGSNVRQVAPQVDLVAFSPSWSPDGAQLAFEARPSGAGDSDIYLYTLGTGVIRQLTSTTDDDHHPTWSPDGTRIVFSRRIGATLHLFSVAVDGSNLRQLTTGATDDLDPAFRPLP